MRATVRNSGTGRSASTTLRYYRSSDSSISTSDTRVGTDSVSGLSASRTSAESISLSAPSSAGTYYYGACVESVSGESNTGNNCSSGVRVTVSSSSGGGGGGGGGSVVTSYAGNCTVGLVLGPGGSCDVGSDRFQVLSDGRGRYGSGITAGTGITLNDFKATRISGTNNWRIDGLPSGTSGGGGGGSGSPDLVVDSPSVSDSTLTTGQSFTLRTTVRNSGTGRSASTTLRYYRSSNSTISTSDTEVGTDSVSGLSASGTSAESISLTAPSSAGTYYYGACVVSVSGESNTNNNCSDGVRVTVSSGGTPPPSGDAITVRITTCSGSRNEFTGLVFVTIGGTLQAHKRVSNLLITGYANGQSVGTDFLNAMSAGQSQNFIISGIISTSASTLSCRVSWNATVHGKNSQGVVDER